MIKTKKLTSREVVELLGRENCESLIVNALKQHTKKANGAKKKIKLWQHCLMLNEHWFVRLVLLNWFWEDKRVFDNSSRHLRRLLALQDNTPFEQVDLEALKEQISMPELVESYGVSLRKCGNHFKTKCPHHSEKSPSYHVYQDHSHCFGCHEHHDVISFTQEMEGCSFKEALKKLKN